MTIHLSPLGTVLTYAFIEQWMPVNYYGHLDFAKVLQIGWQIIWLIITNNFLNFTNSKLKTMEGQIYWPELLTKGNIPLFKAYQKNPTKLLFSINCYNEFYGASLSFTGNINYRWPTALSLPKNCLWCREPLSKVTLPLWVTHR